MTLITTRATVGSRILTTAKQGGFIAMTLMTAVVLSASSNLRAEQVSTTWVGATGDWSTAANWWSDDIPGAHVPDSDDSASINNNGTARILGPGAVCDGLVLGANPVGASRGNIELVGGGLEAGAIQVGRHDEGIGQVDLSATSTVTVAGHCTLGYNAGSQGTWNIADAASSLSSYWLVVGDAGTGNFTQQNGSVSVTDVLAIGGDEQMVLGPNAAGTGTYALNDGTLTTHDTYLGGYQAHFNHASGTHTIDRLLVVGGTDGRYSLSGGSVSSGLVQVSGKIIHTDGTFTSGHIQLSQLNTVGGGTYELHDGNMSAGWMAIDDGLSLFDQRGGSANFTDYVNIISGGRLKLSGTGSLETGDLSIGPGTLEMTGGTITADNLCVAHGSDSTGSMTHSSGSVTIAETMTLGHFAFGDDASDGTYTLEGNAVLTVEGDSFIGDAGTGTFIQKNGQLTAADTYVGNQDGSFGFCTLEDGTFTANGLYVGYEGSGTFTHTGGSCKSKWLTVGHRGSGYYSLEGGQLETGSLKIGFLGGQGRFDYHYGSFEAGYLSVASGIEEDDGGGFFAHWDFTHDAGLRVSGVLECKSGDTRYDFTLDGSVEEDPGGGDPIPHTSRGELWEGRITAKNMTIGKSHAAEVSLNGGTVELAGDLVLGDEPGSSGKIWGGADVGVQKMIVGRFGTGVAELRGLSPAAGVVIAEDTGSDGFYRLSWSEINTPYIKVGSEGEGFFVMEFSTGSVGELIVGEAADGRGQVEFVQRSLLNTINTFVGCSGTGYFNHHPYDAEYPRHNVTADLVLASESADSFGEYHLYGGTVTTQDTYVGSYGHGRFLHDGGTHTPSEGMSLGYYSGSHGYYLIGGGSLTTKKIWVGGDGSAEFVQEDETVAVTENLMVGDVAGTGKYYITGGTLDLTNGKISVGAAGTGKGEFHLNGGTVIADKFQLAHPADFKPSGADFLLRVNELLGFGDNQQFPGSLHIGFQSTASPDTAEHSIGTDQVLGVNVRLVVSYDQGAIFIQDAGSVSVGEYLVIGDQATGGNGWYVLDGGTLNTGGTYLGVHGQGWFDQRGGSHTVVESIVIASESAGSGGCYRLYDGSISSAYTYVGARGEGEFEQRGGSHTVANTLILGEYETSTGSYWMNAGTLQAKDVTVGWLGASTFDHHGSADVRVGGELAVGVENTGQYYISGGDLHTGSVVLADQAAGEFLHMGGSHVVTGDITIAKTGGVEGKYVLQFGQLNVGGSILDGQGDSRLVLCGGGLNVAGDIVVDYLTVGGNAAYERPHGRTEARAVTLGPEVGYSGALAVSGGTLDTEELIVGLDGLGIFEILAPDAEVIVSDTLYFGPESIFNAVPGATIHMTGSIFENESTQPADLAGLSELMLIFEGGSEDLDPFEVAGEDLGPSFAGFVDNFALDTLMIGGADIGQVQLVDLFDNQGDGEANEALYVRNLIVGAGSSLDLGDLNLYYGDATIDPGATINAGSGALLQAVPEPATLLMLLMATVCGIGCTGRRGRSTG